MTLANDLRAARALIDTPEKWGKGSGLEPPDEPKFCALSAAHKANRGNWDAVGDALQAALPDDWKGWFIFDFNDHPDTTHADMMALFDRAIAAAEEQET